jgi:hypothetical protein
MPFIDAFARAEAHYHAQVSQATWGHLAPLRNKRYSGHIVFALGCFGSDDLNQTALSCELDGLDASPWFFDAMTEFLQSLGGEAGGVYRWDGTFKNYEFKGTVRRMELI